MSYRPLATRLHGVGGHPDFTNTLAHDDDARFYDRQYAYFPAGRGRYSSPNSSPGVRRL